MMATTHVHVQACTGRRALSSPRVVSLISPPQAGVEYVYAFNVHNANIDQADAHRLCRDKAAPPRDPYPTIKQTLRC